jgi:hypothetical protein
MNLHPINGTSTTTVGDRVTCHEVWKNNNLVESYTIDANNRVEYVSISYNEVSTGALQFKTNREAYLWILGDNNV